MGKRRAGFVFVILGAVLLAAALLLFLHNQDEDRQAGESADAAMEAIRQVIGEGGPQMLDLSEEETTPDETGETEEGSTEPTALTAVEIDGNRYIGYLSIPAYDLELPILETWSEAGLRVAPCLQYGSPLTDDAVIAGHNYDKHFLTLHKVQPGDYLTFTDMTGYTIEYGVVETKIIDPRNVSEAVDSGYDLTLYTCTIGGQSRVLVCCNRLEHYEE